MIISRMSVRNTAVWLSSLVVALSLWLPVDAAVFGDGSEQHSRSIDMQDVTFHAGDPERGLPPSISIPIFQNRWRFRVRLHGTRAHGVRFGGDGSTIGVELRRTLSPKSLTLVST